MLDRGFGAGWLSVHDPECRCGRASACRTRVLYPGAHEPVIGHEVWQEYLEARQAVNALPRRARTPVHPLSGLLVCGHCQGGMHMTTRGDMPARSDRNPPPPLWAPISKPVSTFLPSGLGKSPSRPCRRMLRRARFPSESIPHGVRTAHALIARGARAPSTPGNSYAAYLQRHSWDQHPSMCTTTEYGFSTMPVASPQRI
jgi:hypothetical protein